MAESTQPRPKILDPVKLIASGGAAVGAMLCGSFFGDSGTLFGVFSGSIVSGGLAAVFEHAGGKVRSKKVSIAGIKVSKRSLRRAGIGAAIAGVTAAALVGTVYLTEVASGKTLHGLVTSSRDYGTSWTPSTTPPSPAPTVPAPASDSAAPSPTATSVPTVSPSSSSVTLSPSPSPTVTTTIVPTIVPSPVISPTSSPSVNLEPTPAISG